MYINNLHATRKDKLISLRMIYTLPRSFACLDIALTLTPSFCISFTMFYKFIFLIHHPHYPPNSLPSPKVTDNRRKTVYVFIQV